MIITRVDNGNFPREIPGKFPTLLDSRFPGMSLYFPGNSRPVLFNKWRNFLEKMWLFEKFCFKNAIKRGIFEKKIDPLQKIFEDLPNKIFLRKFCLAIYVWNTFLYRVNTTGIRNPFPGIPDSREQKMSGKLSTLLEISLILLLYVVSNCVVSKLRRSQLTYVNFKLISTIKLRMFSFLKDL